MKPIRIAKRYGINDADLINNSQSDASIIYQESRGEDSGGIFFCVYFRWASYKPASFLSWNQESITKMRKIKIRNEAKKNS